MNYFKKSDVRLAICFSLLWTGLIASAAGQGNEVKKRPNNAPAPQKQSPANPTVPKSENEQAARKYKLAVAPFTIGQGVGWTPASLDNKLAAAAKNGSLYFRKIPANTLMESRAQLQELNRVQDETIEPDYLLLNCSVEKVDGQRFEISATLASADRSNEIAVVTAFANASNNTAAELTAELWRKLDQPLEILQERPNLLGEWEDITLEQRITIKFDEGVGLNANPSEYWGKLDSAKWQALQKKAQDAGIEQRYEMWSVFDGQWRRGMLEGRFSGSNGYFSSLIIATYQEDRLERRLNLSFPNGKSLVWRYLPPEVDTGYWTAPDGRSFNFVLGVDRISGRTGEPAQSDDQWNRLEAFLRGEDLYISYLRGDRITGRGTGKLLWSRDYSKPSKMVIDGQEWKFSPNTY